MNSRSGLWSEWPAWVRAAEWVMLAILSFLFLRYSFVPAWRTLKSEFPNYYLAAALYHRRIPVDRVYEWTWFQRQNDHLGVYDGLVSFAPNPPTSVLALIPFAGLQPLAAKRLWLISSLVFLGSALWILHQVTQLGWRRLILISLFCVLPLRVDFLYARPYVFLLLLISAAYHCSRVRRDRASGVMWAAAAAMKLFPALAVIFLVRKRNWRAMVGFVVGATAIVTISILTLGIEVHQVFLREVLTQASRGDWLGPYVLSQNSFITLCSRLFLFEPDLNPSPLINSRALYAIAMAATFTILVFSFLISIRDDERPQAARLHWAALVPLLLLLSTTTAPDHSCLLIFAAIVGFDTLRAAENKKIAFTFVLLYIVACAPVPARISAWCPIYRLVATTALYFLLLRSSGRCLSGISGKRWLAAAFVVFAALTFNNLRVTANREEDFARRIPTRSNGYRSANPVALANGLAFTQMYPTKYGPVFLTNGVFHDLALPGDALSIAASETNSLLYSELTGGRSAIARLHLDQPGSAPENLIDGQEPSLSHNGKWLAFIREETGKRTGWLMPADRRDAPQMVLPAAYKPLDLAVTDDGDVIAAAGKVSEPRLWISRRETKQISPLSAFPHPARYPAVSPDGNQLAFSVRLAGSWHLFVRHFATGRAQQLTHASCNAISPSWENNQIVLYATDCGRGVGLSALARVVLPN